MKRRIAAERNADDAFRRLESRLNSAGGIVKPALDKPTGSFNQRLFDLCAATRSDGKGAGKGGGSRAGQARLSLSFHRVTKSREELINEYYASKGGVPEKILAVKPVRVYVNADHDPGEVATMVAHRWQVDGVRYVMYPAYDYRVDIEVE